MVYRFITILLFKLLTTISIFVYGYISIYIQPLEYVIPTAAPAAAAAPPKSPLCYGVSPCYGVSLC